MMDKNDSKQRQVGRTYLLFHCFCMYELNDGFQLFAILKPLWVQARISVCSMRSKAAYKKWTVESMEGFSFCSLVVKKNV